MAINTFKWGFVGFEGSPPDTMNLKSSLNMKFLKNELF
jgi:hypothetical protein